MAKRRALIIDSRERDVQNLREMLEDGDYQVTVASNGDDGVRLAQDLYPEVVLLAIQSPGLNGLQILRDLKKRGTTKGLPVLILLEKFDEEYAAQGLQMGAADYLLKAAGQDFLLRRVGVLARIRQQERQRRDVIYRYKGFFDGEQHGLFLSTREGRFLDVDQNLVRLLGYSDRNELLEIDIENDLYFDPQDRQNFREIIGNQGHVDDLKVNFKRKDGEKITMLLSGRVVRDEKGEIAGYEGYNVELTEEAEAAQSLEKDPEERRFLGRFLKHLVPRILPYGSDFFSLMKMTELIAERYEKVERLGLGSFGEVWKVRDTEREGLVVYSGEEPEISKWKALWKISSSVNHYHLTGFFISSIEFLQDSYRDTSFELSKDQIDRLFSVVDVIKQKRYWVGVSYNEYGEVSLITSGVYMAEVVKELNQEIAGL